MIKDRDELLEWDIRAAILFWSSLFRGDKICGRFSFDPFYFSWPPTTP